MAYARRAWAAVKRHPLRSGLPVVLVARPIQLRSQRRLGHRGDKRESPPVLGVGLHGRMAGETQQVMRQISGTDVQADHLPGLRSGRRFGMHGQRGVGLTVGGT
jgi:hypothetical protein